MRFQGTTTARSVNPTHLRTARAHPRLAMLFALVMALGSLIPAASALAAPSDPLPANGRFQVAGTSSLEVDVVRCPEGFDPNDLFGTCHGNGIDGVEVQVSSVDTALGVDQTETTDASGGPGRTTFTDLPAGDYTVNVGLAPEAGVRYYVYCGVSGGGNPLPPNPDDALSTVVTVPDATPVACDLYVIPTGSAADPDGDEQPVEAGESTIDLFAYTCEAGALPDDGDREFEDFQQACTDEAAGVEFHLITSDDTDTEQFTDDDGESEFTYPADEPVRFYSGVPLEAEEWLFCAIDGGDPENVTIDEDGVSTFENAEAEDRVCSWFLVEEDNATVEPTEAPTEQATEVPTEQPTEAPDTESSIEISAFTCPAEAGIDPASTDRAAFVAECGDTVVPDADFNLNTGELQFDDATDDEGQLSFTYPVGNEVDFFAAVPLEADEALFCSLDGGATFSFVEMDDEGVAHFENDNAADRVCAWYLIEEAPATEVPTEAPTEAPTVEPTVDPTAEPTTEPTEAPAAGEGAISILASTCPDGFDPEGQALDYDTLSANCAEPVADVSFIFGFANGDEDVRLAQGETPIVFESLDPGTYTLYSDVPLEAADEYVFCTADGGNRYEKDLTDRGVTTFGDLQSEQIACEWYIVPLADRNDETGGSLEIHLAVCPVDYAGNAIFDDCHGNGLDGYEFALEGPGGTQTATTAIPQSPGPGIVTFTGLAAGDYTFNGGPPGDFGEVELYCSTQPDNGTPDYAIDGAMASLTLAENQDVLCDWYFIPEDGSGQTPTPTPTVTPEPERAEILVTLYACPPAASQSGTYGGASRATFEEECTDPVNDVTFRLGDPDSAPLSAKTGVSGEGTVRFFDLLPGDLTMTPALPSDLTSVAVFCAIDDGDVYQKALSNGGTTFVDVNGESIACDWYAVEDREEPAPGPTGSITIREYLCEKNRSEIIDWDAECAPGATGTSYTIANTATDAAAEGTPGEDGILVFPNLANGFYTLEQETGNWCRAVADRVDSESRVIVEGGGNTDVVLYQCNAIEDLPDTGTGPGGTIAADESPLTGVRLLAIALGLLAMPLGWAGWTEFRKRQAPAPTPPSEPNGEPLVDASGRAHMRFR